MKKLNTKGFTAFEIIILIVVLGLLVAVIYMFINNRQDSPTQPASTESQAPANSGDKSSTAGVKLQKEYRNDDYGFKFNYPEDWQISTDLKDIGRGTPEGTITVSSPSGTKVNFRVDLGGKGGDCWDDQANAHTARTCATATVFSAEKFDSGKPETPLYLYKTSITKSEQDGGGTTYWVYIGTGENGASEPKTTLVTFVPGWVINTSYGNVYTQVEGGDNTTKEYFDSKTTVEATPILTSFRLTR